MTDPGAARSSWSAAAPRSPPIVNSCPHTGGPLDWVEDQFLDLDRRHILCATHGALFRIEDGHCLAGPCKGKGLTAVAIVVAEGEVRLAE